MSADGSTRARPCDELGGDGFEHFFRALVAEIDAANHEKRHDHPGKEVAEGQGNGQQNQELVAK